MCTLDGLISSEFDKTKPVYSKILRGIGYVFPSSGGIEPRIPKPVTRSGDGIDSAEDEKDEEARAEMRRDKSEKKQKPKKRKPSPPPPLRSPSPSNNED